MKHRYVWLISLILLLLLAACSGSTETEEQSQVEPSPDSTPILSTIPAPEGEDSDLTSFQQDAYDQISAAVGYEPELLVEMGLPRFLAPYLPTSSDDPETAARDFFEALPAVP